MNHKAHSLAVLGAASQALIPLGLGISQWRLHTAVSGLDLNNLEDLERVTASIHVTTHEMGASVTPLAWALMFSLLGLVLFLIALIPLSYRRAWAFWFACIYGGCLVLAFPVGTLLGMFMLIYALRHRKEFAMNRAETRPLTA